MNINKILSMYAIQIIPITQKMDTSWDRERIAIADNEQIRKKEIDDAKWLEANKLTITQQKKRRVGWGKKKLTKKQRLAKNTNIKKGK